MLPPASRTHREIDNELDNEFFQMIERDLDLRSFGGDWGKKGNANAIIT